MTNLPYLEPVHHELYCLIRSEGFSNYKLSIFLREYFYMRLSWMDDHLLRPIYKLHYDQSDATVDDACYKFLTRYHEFYGRPLEYEPIYHVPEPIH